jgi:two-component system phosphate regulon sensor histidine kinase PhoR
MKKRTINIIILLMSVALFGISIIQFYWLKKGVDLNGQNFNSAVLLAMTSVKQQLENDAEKLQVFKKDLFNKADSPLKKIMTPAISYRDSRRQKQAAELVMLFKPELAIENISLPDLNRYLRLAFEQQEIDLEYDYGVYDYKSNNFKITNGKYTANPGMTQQASEGPNVKNLERNAFEVFIFNRDDKDPPAALRVFFPKKTSFLISSVFPSLLSSVILTGLILFCFVYTINVILTQKKVSLMKTDFINNMTHEFKTPIATISLAADSINNPKVMSKPHLIERYANIIKEENSRMLNQVEKVLNIARLDKEDFQLKIIELDVNAIVASVVEMTELKIQNRDGKLTKNLNAKNSLFNGDETHISNILHNLLDNANKYSAEKPIINVSTVDEKGGIKIIIEDQGIGMSKDDIKRIFEKFYRVSTGNLHNVKGFGLGLSYVKAIVDAHKGRIEVSSEINSGSKFSIFIPSDFSAVK